MGSATPSTTIASLATSVDDRIACGAQEESSNRSQRDNTVTAHAHQFRKILELSDVVIQVSALRTSILRTIVLSD